MRGFALLVVFMLAIVIGYYFGSIYSSPLFIREINTLTTTITTTTTTTTTQAIAGSTIAGVMWIAGHYLIEEGYISYEFFLILNKINGYKYVVVFPYSADKIFFAEEFDPDDLSYYWSFSPQPLNSTHSYIEVMDSIHYSFWYYVSTDVDDIYRGCKLAIYVMREDVDVVSVLA
jgi:hypothetical protein